ncbi:MAG TPA: PAS domain S-box protein [Segetibacter sp.]
MKRFKKKESAFLLLLLIGLSCYFISQSSIFLNHNNFPGYLCAVILILILVVNISFVISRFTMSKPPGPLENLHLFFDDLPIATCLIDINSFKFIYVNNAMVDNFGYSKEELLSICYNEINCNENQNFDELKSIVINGLNKKQLATHKKKNGEIVNVTVCGHRISFKNRAYIFIQLKNIRTIVNVADEITADPDFTSYILENFPVDVAIFDKSHRYILLNKTAVKNDEMRKWMIGKDDFDYFARKGVDMSIARKRRKKFLQAIEGKTVEWIDEHTIDGKIKYVLRKFLPYRKDGDLKYVYGYGMDITEIRTSQIQREAYLLQLEKLAFTTSHKIRQPICNLKGLISLLEMEKIESKTITEIVEGMQQSVVVMDEFTRELGEKLHEFKQNLSATKKEGTTDLF